MNIFIPYKTYPGKINMSIDIALLNCAIENKIDFILRLYGWNHPTITLGRNQKQESLNQTFCKKNNVELVKRPTGGRALLHDNELTYSFICPENSINKGHSVIGSYKEICEALIIAFQNIGIKLEHSDTKKITDNPYCMDISTGADLRYKNKKFIGSAQFRKKGYILQHGSMPIDIEHKLINNIFGTEKSLSSLPSIMSSNRNFFLTR